MKTPTSPSICFDFIGKVSNFDFSRAIIGFSFKKESLENEEHCFSSSIHPHFVSFISELTNVASSFNLFALQLDVFNKFVLCLPTQSHLQIRFV